MFISYSPAQAARWSNLPGAALGFEGRAGLQTTSLKSRSWSELWELRAACSGSGTGVGLDALRQHLAAEETLAGGDRRWWCGRGAFTIAVLGRPDTRGTFAIQVRGHHLAQLSACCEGEEVCATPAFRGVEPFAPAEGWGPLDIKHEAPSSLPCALHDDQLAVARLRRTPRDLLLGPGEDWGFPESNYGLPAVELDAGQRGQLLRALLRLVDDVEDDASQRVFEKYQREVDETHVVLAGSPSLRDRGDYVRIDAPRVWIEMSLRRGIGFPDPHPHAIWRHKVSDYTDASEFNHGGWRVSARDA